VQVFLFTRDFSVDWTNNVSERGAKAAKRHQAVSGYWHSERTLARWCRIRGRAALLCGHGRVEPYKPHGVCFVEFGDGFS
jgi:transposase